MMRLIVIFNSEHNKLKYDYAFLKSEHQTALVGLCFELACTYIEFLCGSYPSCETTGDTSICCSGTHHQT